VESNPKSIVPSRAEVGRAFEAMRPRLLAYAKGFVRDDQDAEDVVQDACLVALRRVTDLSDPAKFESWLFRTVQLNCLHVLSLRTRRLARELSLPLVPESALMTVMSDGGSPRLTPGLNALGPDRRQLVELHYAEGRTLAEIAVLTTLSVDTVKMRLNAVRGALRRRYGEHLPSSTGEAPEFVSGAYARGHAPSSPVVTLTAG